MLFHAFDSLAPTLRYDDLIRDAPFGLWYMTVGSTLRV